MLENIFQQLLMLRKHTLHYRYIEFLLEFNIKRIQSGSQRRDKNV